MFNPAKGGFLICWILVVICFVSNTRALATPKRDGQAKQKRILLVSLGIVGHAVPLARIGSEIVANCCARTRKECVVDFASHSSVEQLWVEETVSVSNSPCLGRFINLGELPKAWFDKLNKISTDPSLFRGTLSVFTDLYLESLPFIYNAVDEHMRRGVDLAVVDIGTIGAIEKARAFNVTLVVHSPTVWADSFGQFEPPHWLPAFGSGLSKDMTLAERCLNALLPRLLSVALQPALMRVNKLRFDAKLAPYQSSHQVFQDVRIVSSTALGFEYSRLAPPIHAYVGPILPRRASEPNLVKGRRLKRFLQKSKNKRLIIIKFGSTLPLDLASLQSFKLGLDWLVRKENASIIWYLPRDRIEQLKPFNSNRLLPVSTFNVDVYFGLLQLRKPKVALSITSCGMASVQESLIFGFPVLCVPIVADQADVAARLKDSRAGLVLAKEDISPTSVLLAVNTLLNDNQYSRNANVIRGILQMAGGRERAAAHILSAFYNSDEFLMLKQSLSWHKRVGLDVSAVFASLFVTFGMGFLLHARFRHGRKYGF